MVLFLVLAICEWLPVRGRHSHTDRSAAERLCIWCSDQVVEDSRHALCCSANWPELRKRRRDVDRILKCLPRDITLRPVVRWQLPEEYTEYVMDRIPDQLDRQLCRQFAQDYLVRLPRKLSLWSKSGNY